MASMQHMLKAPLRGNFSCPLFSLVFVSALLCFCTISSSLLAFAIRLDALKTSSPGIAVDESGTISSGSAAAAAARKVPQQLQNSNNASSCSGGNDEATASFVADRGTVQANNAPLEELLPNKSLETQLSAATDAQITAAEAQELAEAAQEAAVRGDVAAAQQLADAATAAALKAQELASIARSAAAQSSSNCSASDSLNNNAPPAAAEEKSCPALAAEQQQQCLTGNLEQENTCMSSPQCSLSLTDLLTAELSADVNNASHNVKVKLPTETSAQVDLALERLAAHEDAAEAAGERAQDKEVTVVEYVTAAQAAAERFDRANRAALNARQARKPTLEAAAVKEAEAAAADYDKLALAAEAVTTEVQLETGIALAHAVAAQQLRQAVNEALVADVAVDQEQKQQISEAQVAAAAALQGEVPALLLAPKHFRISNLDKGTVLKIFFHNSFAPFTTLPCAALHAEASLCKQHPRCILQYELDNQVLLQRCILDNGYLNISANTKDFCTAADESYFSSRAATVGSTQRVAAAAANDQRQRMALATPHNSPRAEAADPAVTAAEKKGSAAVVGLLERELADAAADKRSSAAAVLPDKTAVKNKASPLFDQKQLEAMAVVTEEEMHAVALDLLQEAGVDGEAFLQELLKDGKENSSRICSLVQALSKEALKTDRDPRCEAIESGTNMNLTTEALLASSFGFVPNACTSSNASTTTPSASSGFRSASIRSHSAANTSPASAAALKKGAKREAYKPTSISPTNLFSFLQETTKSAEAPIRIGINGMGRIGRLVFRIAMSRPDVTVTHINCSMEPEYIAYMLKFDSVHGRFEKEVIPTASGLIVDGKKITISNARDPSEIPWASNGADYVCESTGAFCTSDLAGKHTNREGGAKHVVISAPAKDESTPTLVVGVNAEQDYDSSMQVVSCASCTTNGLAPLVKVIDENFGLLEGLMTTVHAATGTQKVVDGSSKKDWRGGRAAGGNIIPSSTGAAKAVARCMPQMKGKLTGMAFRVPTLDVSVVDLTCRLNKGTTYDEIKETVKRASETYMRGIIGYTEEPVVSQDIVGAQCSTVFDANAGIMLNPNFVKLVSWYDNEYAYSARLVDLLAIMAAKDGVVPSGTGLDRKPF